MTETIIVDLLIKAGMEPIYVWTGFIGSIFHLMTSSEKMNFKKVFAILFMGPIFTGYISPYFVTYRAMNRALSYGVSIGIGFFTVPFFEKLSKAFPEIWAIGFDFFKSWVKRDK